MMSYSKKERKETVREIISTGKTRERKKRQRIKNTLRRLGLEERLKKSIKELVSAHGGNAAQLQQAAIENLAKQPFSDANIRKEIKELERVARSEAGIERIRRAWKVEKTVLPETKVKKTIEGSGKLKRLLTKLRGTGIEQTKINKLILDMESRGIVTSGAIEDYLNLKFYNLLKKKEKTEEVKVKKKKKVAPKKKKKKSGWIVEKTVPDAAKIFAEPLPEKTVGGFKIKQPVVKGVHIVPGEIVVDGKIIKEEKAVKGTAVKSSSSAKAKEETAAAASSGGGGSSKDEEKGLEGGEIIGIVIIVGIGALILWAVSFFL